MKYIEELIKYLEKISNDTNPSNYLKAIEEISDSLPYIRNPGGNQIEKFKKTIIKFMRNMPRNITPMLSDDGFVCGFIDVFKIMTGYIQRSSDISHNDVNMFNEYIDSMRGIDLEPFYEKIAHNISDIDNIDMFRHIISTFYTVEMDNVVKQKNDNSELSSECNYEDKDRHKVIDKLLKEYGFRSTEPEVIVSPIDVDCEIMLRAAIENKSIPSEVHYMIMKYMSRRDPEFAKLVNSTEMTVVARIAWFKFLTDHEFPIQE